MVLARNSDRSDVRLPFAVLAGIGFLRLLYYARQGIYPILDDWSIGYYGQEDPWSALSGSFLASRPLAWVGLSTIYGFASGSPLQLAAIAGLANLLASSMLLLALHRLVGVRVALIAALLWSIAYSQLPLAIWAPTVPINMAVAGLLAACIESQHGHIVRATVLVALASLSYELVLLPGFLVVLITACRQRRPGVAVATAGILAGVGIWIGSHPIYRPHLHVANVSDIGYSVIGSAFGLDQGTGAAVAATALVLVGSGLALITATRGSDPGARLVAISAISAIALGTLPWWTLRVPAPPLGDLDRINALTALGLAVLVALGVGSLLHLLRRPTVRVGAAAFVALALLTVVLASAEGVRAWSAAGRDGALALDYLERFQDLPVGHYTIGPTLQEARHRGVTSFGAAGFADAAFDSRYASTSGRSFVATDDPSAFADGPGVLISWTDVLGVAGPSVVDDGVSPLGAVDLVTGVGQRVRVAGWAFDPTDAPSPVAVVVRANGESHTIVADLPRPDIARLYPAAGPHHGFDGSVPVGPGPQLVCVIVPSRQPGHDRALMSPPDRAQGSTSFCSAVAD